MREHLYFVAILPPDNLAWEIDDIRKDFSMRYGAYAALKPPVHITLKEPFKTLPRHEDAILQALRPVGFSMKQNAVSLKNFGQFNERVIYVHVEKTPPLDTLRKEINKAFRSLSPAVEYNKPMSFNPHITIAYRDIPVERFPIAWEEYAYKTYRRSFEAKGFSLLRHDGKQWNVLETFHFTNNNILTLF